MADTTEPECDHRRSFLIPEGTDEYRCPQCGDTLIALPGSGVLHIPSKLAGADDPDAFTKAFLGAAAEALNDGPSIVTRPRLGSEWVDKDHIRRAVAATFVDTEGPVVVTRIVCEKPERREVKAWPLDEFIAHHTRTTPVGPQDATDTLLAEIRASLPRCERESNDGTRCGLPPHEHNSDHRYIHNADRRWDSHARMLEALAHRYVQEAQTRESWTVEPFPADDPQGVTAPARQERPLEWRRGAATVVFMAARPRFETEAHLDGAVATVLSDPGYRAEIIRAARLFADKARHPADREGILLAIDILDGLR